MLDLAAMSALLITKGEALEAHLVDAMQQAAQLVRQEAQDEIGVYQAGWVQLADSTEQQKARMGYSANAPLLATGQLKNSFEYNVSGLKAVIGSNDRTIKYHEFGTSKMPPRPVLLTSVTKKKNEIIELIGQHTANYLWAITA